MLAISAGFAAVSLFDGFMASMRSQMADGFVNRGMGGHLIIEKRGAGEKLAEDPWLYSISRDEQAFINAFVERDVRIKAALRSLALTGIVSNGRSSAVFIGEGIDLQAGLQFRGERWAWDAYVGIPLHLAAEPGAMLGLGLASRLDCPIPMEPELKEDGSYIAKERPFECVSPTVQLSVTTESSQVNAVDIRAIGAVDLQLREFNERWINLPLETAQQLMDSDRLTRVSVLLHDPGDIASFARDFARAVGEKGLDLVAVSWLDHPSAAVVQGGMEILSVFRGLFLTIVAVIAGMSIANTMMKSVNERIREIGTLRSIGFRRKDIVLMFSAEGALLALASCFSGMAAATGLSLLITALGIKFKAGVLSTPIPLGVEIVLPTWLGSMFVIGLISFGASWLVSRRAARQVIAETMRHVA
jgi:putative ABC transport system permease protein